MMRFLAGLGIGNFVGNLPGLVIPLRVFMIACLVLLALAVLVFILFHPSVRDFQ
jgi:hypothetical protein